MVLGQGQGTGSGERLDLFLEGPEGPGEEGFAPAMLILVWMSALFFFLFKMDFPVSLDIVIFFINVAGYITGISLVYHFSVGEAMVLVCQCCAVVER